MGTGVRNLTTLTKYTGNSLCLFVSFGSRSRNDQVSCLSFCLFSFKTLANQLPIRSDKHVVMPENLYQIFNQRLYFY